jgi:6-pyruvoyl-tetrahydropterin synthase
VFSITVRDHLMVAHSLKGQVFGPAQRLHGATYVVEVTLRRGGLGPDGIVADLGLAARALHAVLEPLTYRNLDDVPELAGMNTTTEMLARLIADRLAERIQGDELGREGREIATIVATLHESPMASAGYERAL